jgi:aspartyl-tRNA(Asn)/glutamyl-tRNA(Gln) amidotransferase subunit C
MNGNVSDIDITHLSRLSMLEIAPEEEEKIKQDIQGIMSMIETLNTADTSKVNPLAHPLEQTQPLREDTPTPCHSREIIQQLAPKTRDGLYIVPQFIEEK